MASPAWTLREIQRQGTLKVILYREAGWDNHQDVIACKPLTLRDTSGADAPASHLPWTGEQSITTSASYRALEQADPEGNILRDVLTRELEAVIPRSRNFQAESYSIKKESGSLRPRSNTSKSRASKRSVNVIVSKPAFPGELPGHCACCTMREWDLSTSHNAGFEFIQVARSHSELLLGQYNFCRQVTDINTDARQRPCDDYSRSVVSQKA